MSILSSMIPSASDSALLAILAHSCFATSIIFSDIFARSDGGEYIKKLKLHWNFPLVSFRVASLSDFESS